MDKRESSSISTVAPRIAIYPGTFDPMTNGHLNVLVRVLRMFDKVIIAVAENSKKVPLFSIEERKHLIGEVVSEFPQVEVDTFSGLLVEYAKKRGVFFLIRGLRATGDFEYEFRLAHMNRRIAPQVESVFVMTAEEYFYVSSSAVKEVASLGGDVSSLVPQTIDLALRKKLSGISYSTDDMR